ncbi:3-deoxy-manno-octulosonate cytidylyltransferase (CMP-KDO synthetase) [Dysgonomonas sp. PFB1-18]|uniref:3-deoxy-manno-octulosonate cytidylyltransferase n=1 Tax=unclassified Dysgonomonas TaxID=2630389 RepID=UPI00247589F4|nr:MULTISPECIES: 3-deoxy-manno-octulosonate cytidylyltransferase [unclassified Dysgonomonas]MDH6310627.1 3-deoxy-manno-octulosonate cytidylyltransferase (CMP-KDO synthetase) [Dysgonomonas sp. PF1-14]MDH6340478.1 3-deoxy-manno-octulosonate cytidylyltransferase (CMP-KDO synthetase) [Dysgonomonas sp. PF1-16]MDH6382114.1 3-deoxy-manno-octulosonate cytidylyltransferase (CMP-KDO synthetase) [Dysgonomonas sp. PFB1-18]MDH6399458.1 3-deoxy-manno-octulosonate cytidylyltransferase (CMP-KDO synthetase) [Dy
MKFIAIIPARYASTRFPGKPLADMGGKPMIQRVYEQVKKAVEEVWVATDDSRIFDAVESFGGKAVMTSSGHRSGTDRIQEAYTKIGQPFDVIINVQGDEPFIQPEQIEALKNCFDSSTVELATLVKPFKKEDGFDALFNANSPKVVINKNDEAIYFSRSIVPYIRDVHHAEWLDKHTFYKHVGMYAYCVDVLAEITQLPPSSLEKAESLEQLRWIENGYRIRVGYTDAETIGIDTPEDMERALKFLQ